MLNRIQISRKKSDSLVDKRISIKVNRILEAIATLNKHKHEIEEIISRLTVYCEANDKFYDNEIANDVSVLGEKIKAVSTTIQSVSIKKFFSIDKNKIKGTIRKMLQAENPKLAPWNLRDNVHKHPMYKEWMEKYGEKKAYWADNPNKEYIKDFLTKSTTNNDGSK